MRRNSGIRLAFYAAILFSLVFFYHKFTKEDSVSNGKASSLNKATDKVAIHLEDVIAVPDGEVPSAEILYKNIMNERPFAPVVIFSKSYCGFSKAAKHLLLEKYTISPPPRVVELDLHPQGAELQNYIASVTGRRTVPNVLVLKDSKGGADDMHALHEAGELASKFEEWGKGHLKISLA